MENKILNYDDEEEIRNLLLYHSVKKVSKDCLVLDNGIKLKIIPNSSWCSCGAGDYRIKELNGCDNIITNVSFDFDTDDDDYNSYKIFVFSENTKVKLLDVEGFDGSGWYGTGYEIKVMVV